ncbi:hypothetical protein F2P56_004196 [Juglans regia]|uniref:Uncharacterized protein n=2 Tax=Juglans regia TaxID=51240 RepID=A0A833Y4Z9_JUGRE|nr:uncharacterized protein LOC108980928 [Juglans regia]KAF5477571.1 hypothetical protein F2P56_004196 [Juglans regia]
MAVLLEPFQSVDKIQVFMRMLRFDKVITNENDGGKIWVFWKSEVDVQVVHMSSQYVSLRISEGDIHFLGNFIYAKCNRYERQMLWEELSSDRMGVEPCLFAGDFNIIRSDVERCGGCPRTRIAMDEFNRWIHQGGLMEMNSQGGKFTWCNGQQGLSRAWAKLDRVLVDANFLTLFPSAHCSGLFKLASKLKKLKVALREWNKRVFGRTNNQIAILEENVESLEHLLQRDWDNDIERELVRCSNESSSWRRREDIRLAQMAKIKRRKIHKLRTSNGMESNSPEEIHLGAVDYFSEFLHRSNPAREMPDLTSLISSVIDEED